MWRICVGWCWAGWLLVGSAMSADAPRPNILFIYTDDQPYKTIGCYPESPRWVKTPQIDRLAASGVRFHRAYMGSWCMPSRATLLTGLLPHSVESMRMAGTYPGSTYDPQQCRFWPAELRKHGYQTAQIGKWHTGVDTGFGRDWDFQIVWNRPGHPENAGNYYKNQILSFNGQEREVAGYSTDNYTDWAVEYIRGEHRAANKPWYLWLCYGAVHGPTTPAERHRGSYQNEQAPVPANIFGPRADKPAYLESTQAWAPGPRGTPQMYKKNKPKVSFDTDKPGLDYQAWVQQVNECARAIDEGVGRLLAALRESGQLENTLIVFTADQGYALGEHGLSQKQAPYDAAFASPLIVSWPGVTPAGKLSRQSVNSADLVATFCATTGLTTPWQLHGRDITPLLREPETASFPSPTLMEHMGQLYGTDTRHVATEKVLQGGVPPWVLIRVGQYKYIRNLVVDEVEELYDLDTDPEELVNLALRSEHAELLSSLRGQMIAELRRTQAPFVEAMPRPRTQQ